MKIKTLGINSAIQFVEFWHLALRLDSGRKRNNKTESNYKSGILLHEAPTKNAGEEQS